MCGTSNGMQVIVLLLKSIIKCLIVSHPLGCERVVQDVDFIEHNEQWRFGLVQNAQCVHHVGHESVWVFAPDSVSHVEVYRRESRAKGLGDDLTAR